MPVDGIMVDSGASTLRNVDNSDEERLLINATICAPVRDSNTSICAVVRLFSAVCNSNMVNSLNMYPKSATDMVVSSDIWVTVRLVIRLKMSCGSSAWKMVQICCWFRLVTNVIIWDRSSWL